jgi:hypothetical protein
VASGRSWLRLFRVLGDCGIPHHQGGGSAPMWLTGSSGSLESLAPKPVPRCSNHRLGSRSFGLPHSLLDLCRCRRIPEGFPARWSSLAEASDCRPSWPWSPLRSAPTSRWSRLSVTPPLMRFAFAPPPTSPVCVHSREQAPFGAALQHASHVPPSWFLTTTTVCSALWFAGLLHPATGQGSSRFGLPQTCSRPGGRCGPTVPSPRRGSHPSKSSPRRQPLLHHCSPLPSGRYWTTR